MLQADAGRRRNVLIAALLAVIVAAVLYRINRAFGDFLADEGYLWYGVQRVLSGEVPVRDFMSYEVGRYYFSGLLLYPFGTDGLLALRAVLAMVAAISLGISIGLSGAATRESRVWWMIPVALLFAEWLVPRHKVFDIAISALLVLGVYRMLRKPGKDRFFQFGLIVGVAATIGQNHGAYGLVAAVLAFACLWAERSGALSIPSLLAWGLGVIIGYLPVLLTALIAHGFVQAEISALHYILFEYKGTNLPLPIPWPWTHAAHGSFARVMLSLFFVALPISLVLAFIAIVRRVRRGIQGHEALFVAAFTVAVPYANVAFSRADPAHLAQAMVPYLLLAIAMPAFFGLRSRWQPLIVSGLILVSLPVALPLQPRMALSRSARLVPMNVQGDRVMVSQPTHALLEVAMQEYVNGTVLAVPYFPGLMAALHEKSPIWGIYPLFPRKPVFEEKEIARLRAAKPAAILVSRAALDRRKALTYPMTHPEIYRFLQQQYTKKPVPGRMGMELYVPPR
ncbi:hypothetical protein [Oleiagrimonas soli]|uniref:Glycosyltransferase RgtA/B/C/D-like domain-containing protein n=1 Tax=Oleiagrimonas soli TaxID=1543381 RepID=A0A841KKI7_9GAMM|nr:hypothetical protein [Oleiagrimonas soli]MBB6184299.1 hypothetical protein [Oleiagrimonas soli]